MRIVKIGRFCAKLRAFQKCEKWDAPRCLFFVITPRWHLFHRRGEIAASSASHRDGMKRAAFDSVGKALAFGNKRCLGAGVWFPVGPNFSVAHSKRCLSEFFGDEDLKLFAPGLCLWFSIRPVIGWWARCAECTNQ